jgi:cytoskeletal protein CcmA (bactofilin family)
VFLKNDKTNGSGSGAVTIIGPGVRIEGNITFSGYLRVQGEVLGNIVCLDEHHGTTVIHGAGSVTGSIKSPSIIVGGRVQGPLHATASIEVHHGASVLGDVSYKQLAIHEGGVIDGLLKASAAPEKAWEDRRVARSESPDIKELDGPHAHERRASDHFWSKRKIVIGGVLIAILAIFFLWPRHAAKTESPTYVPEPASQVAPSPEPVKVEPQAPPAPPAPVVVPEPRVEAKPAPVPVAAAEPTPDLRKADSSRVINVEGMDADKPGDLFFVSTKEPVVLFKKRRDDAGEGTRIDLASGSKRRFSITEDEIVRVAQGKDLEVFFQGRKLSWGALHSGAWMRFVPLPAPTPAKPAAQ